MRILLVEDDDAVAGAAVRALNTQGWIVDRTARGEPVVDLPGRDMRQRIHDEAVVEQRDAHGMPRLMG